MAFTDDFNRVSGPLEDSPDWTSDGLVPGALAIFDQQLQIDTTDSVGSAYWCPDQGSRDHSVSFTLSPGGRNAYGSYVAVRLLDRNNYVGMRFSNDVSANIQIYHYVAGVATELYSGTHTLTEGDTFKLQAEGVGTAIKAFHNGAVIYSATVAGVEDTTKTGIVARLIFQEYWIDNFAADNIHSDELTPVGLTSQPFFSVPTIELSGFIGISPTDLLIEAPYFSRPSIIGTPAFTFFDDFNRPNETLDVSTGWTSDGAIAGALSIQNNELACLTSDATGSAYYSTDLGRYDHYVQYTVRNIIVNNSAFVCCRLTDSLHFIGVRNNFDNIEVFIRNGTDFSTVNGSYIGETDGLVVGDIIRLEMQDIFWSVYKNDDFVAGGVLTDELPRTTRQGIVARQQQSQPLLDDYVAGVHNSSATVSVTEAADTADATSTQYNSGVVDATEAADTLNSTSSASKTGNAAIVEAADTVVSASTVRLTATASITEADDILMALMVREAFADADITEADDVLDGYILRLPYRRTTGNTGLPYGKDY